MKTHGRANLYFAYGRHLKKWDIIRLSELMVHCGLIISVERDQETGEILRYYETERLYKSKNKLALVREELKGKV